MGQHVRLKIITPNGEWYIDKLPVENYLDEEHRCQGDAQGRRCMNYVGIEWRNNPQGYGPVHQGLIVVTEHPGCRSKIIWHLCWRHKKILKKSDKRASKRKPTVNLPSAPTEAVPIKTNRPEPRSALEPKSANVTNTSKTGGASRTGSDGICLQQPKPRVKLPDIVTKQDLIDKPTNPGSIQVNNHEIRPAKTSNVGDVSTYNLQRTVGSPTLPSQDHSLFDSTSSVNYGFEGVTRTSADQPGLGLFEFKNPLSKSNKLQVYRDSSNDEKKVDFNVRYGDRATFGKTTSGDQPGTGLFGSGGFNTSPSKSNKPQSLRDSFDDARKEGFVFGRDTCTEYGFYTSTDPPRADLFRFGASNNTSLDSSKSQVFKNPFNDEKVEFKFDIAQYMANETALKSDNSASQEKSKLTPSLFECVISSRTELEPSSEVEPDPKIKLEPISDVEPDPEIKREPLPEVKPDPKIKLEPLSDDEPDPEMKLEPLPEVKPDPKIKLEPTSNFKPDPEIQLEPPSLTADVSSAAVSNVSSQTDDKSTQTALSSEECERLLTVAHEIKLEVAVEPATSATAMATATATVTAAATTIEDKGTSTVAVAEISHATPPSPPAPPAPIKAEVQAENESADVEKFEKTQNTEAKRKSWWSSLFCGCV